MLKECLLYKQLNHQKVQCNTCAHRCIILPHQQGICGVRENQNGRLYLLVYNEAISENIDPVEKKPLFNFMPGTQTLSIATAGCNFRCQWCQNADISQASKETNFFKSKIIPREELVPEKVIEDAKNNNCPSISYTYTEPTIFLEYALDCMKLAKKEDLKNIWVSNGYQTPETIRLIAPYLDAVNIDLKCFKNESYLKYCGAKLQPVLDSLILMKKLGIWIEVTTLIIPQFNDSLEELKEIADFIAKKLNKETPWHISRFYPAYKIFDRPKTPIETMHSSLEIGKKSGLKYVYLGNVPGDKFENTYCPKCGELCIKRLGYEIERFDKNGKCQKCNTNLNIIL